MAGEERIRVGFAGAGANTRRRHIPGFQAIEGVSCDGVANRSRSSGEKVAQEFGIRHVYDTWLDLVRADEVNAVCVGTWPYLHCPVVLACLEHGKHVLTEARMAMNAHEARSMLAAARAHPHLVTQIVPAPHTLSLDRRIRELVSGGYLGSILSVDAQVYTGGFPDFDAPMHWRHNRDLSGNNIMSMGIHYEAIMRWVGPAVRVSAMGRTAVNSREDESGNRQWITIPDHVEVTAEMACGALLHLRVSAVSGLAGGARVRLYGTEGTLEVDLDKAALFGGRRGDEKLTEIAIEQEKRGVWRVEEEFVNAIRGTETVTHTNFEDGVRYMEFTDAVTVSMRSGRAVAVGEV